MGESPKPPEPALIRIQTLSYCNLNLKFNHPHNATYGWRELSLSFLVLWSLAGLSALEPTWVIPTLLAGTWGCIWDFFGVSLCYSSSP
jgi:hypothetical protein